MVATAAEGSRNAKVHSHHRWQAILGRNLAAFFDRCWDLWQELLWIDAICINRFDIDEKNSQVRKMHSIYKKADKVVAWLGPRMNDSEVVFKMLNRLAAAAAGHMLHHTVRVGAEYVLNALGRRT